MLSKKERNLLFLEALIITIIIYFFALFLNGYLDEKRIESLNDKMTDTTLNFQVVDVMENFKTNESNNCELQKKYLFQNFKDIKKVGTDINNYGQLFLSENENISLNKQREYFLKQLTLYRTTLEYNKECKDKIVPVIYFYNSKSVSLDKQSLILEEFSLNHINQTIILSFDINYINEPILQMIKNKYNVTYSPFVIINENTTRTLENQNSVVSLNSITIQFLKARGELNGN